MFRIATLFCLFIAFPAAAETAGEVARFRGVAEAENAGATRALSTGASVLLGDTIRTGQETRAEIEFLDGTQVRLGDNSAITINDYFYDPDRSVGRMALDLTTGVFRLITAAATVFQQEALLVQTPTASIGIRGTDFWGQQTTDRLQVALLDDSEIVVSNAAGTVVLNEPLQSTIVTSSATPPSAVFTLTDEQLQAAAGTVAF